jgi:hypothetical protein
MSFTAKPFTPKRRRDWGRGPLWSVILIAGPTVIVIALVVFFALIQPPTPSPEEIEYQKAKLEELIEASDAADKAEQRRKQETIQRYRKRHGLPP